MNKSSVTKPARAVLAAMLPVLAGLAWAGPLETVKPQKGTIHRWITLPAVLRANQQVTLHAKVAGYLKTISVDAGSTVKQGELLAVLETPELTADRTKAEAEVSVATSDYDRLEGARAKSPGLILPQSLDEAGGRLKIAKASLERIDTILSFREITAPFAGMITARLADPGAFIPAGGTGTAGALVTLADISVLRADVHVPEQEAGRIHPGTLARLLIGREAKPVEATVSRHGHSLEPTTATLSVEVDVPNADLKLLAGNYAKVSLAAETHANTLLLPAAAVLIEKTNASVFIPQDGKAKKVPVKAGFNDGQSVEILEGVDANASVMLAPGRPLVDGESITPAK